MNDTPPYPGAPRWVRLSGIAVVAAAVLFAVLMIADPDLHGSHGGHGSSGHAPAAETHR